MENIVDIINCMNAQINNRTCCDTAKTGDCDIEKLLSVDFFRALSDQNRIKMIIYLAKSRVALSVKDISTCCNVDISVVSRHLAILHRAGLLDMNKKGKEVHYELNSKKLARLFRQLADELEPNLEKTEEALP